MKKIEQQSCFISLRLLRGCRVRTLRRCVDTTPSRISSCSFQPMRSMRHSALRAGRSAGSMAVSTIGTCRPFLTATIFAPGATSRYIVCPPLAVLFAILAPTTSAASDVLVRLHVAITSSTTLLVTVPPVGMHSPTCAMDTALHLVRHRPHRHNAGDFWRSWPQHRRSVVTRVHPVNMLRHNPRVATPDRGSVAVLVLQQNRCGHCCHRISLHAGPKRLVRLRPTEHVFL
jgi:hypothetical protein